MYKEEAGRQKNMTSEAPIEVQHGPVGEPSLGGHTIIRRVLESPGSDFTEN